MSDDLTYLSNRIKELGDKSTQILIFLSFAITAVVLLRDSRYLEPNQRDTLTYALWFWVGAIFPVLFGILPLKEFVEWLCGDKTRWPFWYRKIRTFKFVLLWLATALVFLGAIAFACSVHARSTPNAQAHTFTTNRDWVKAARNWGWSGLSLWSDESILRNLSTAVGFRAAFPEYGTWDDEQIKGIAVQAPAVPYRGVPPGFELDSKKPSARNSALTPEPEGWTPVRKPDVPDGWKQGTSSAADRDSR